MSLIGSTRNCAGTLLQSFGLVCFQSILTPKDFRTAAKQTGCAPKKERPLVPEVVSWLMMLVALHTESMTQGLIRTWSWVRSVCPQLPETCISEEAFCQARGQLPLQFWRALWKCLQGRYEQRFASVMRWKGIFRVLAGDGSEVELPRTPLLVSFFGCPKGSKGKSRQPQGRLVALCSVFTGFCLSFMLVPLRFSEHTALRHLIRRLKINDLLLLDRGFFSYATIWRITDQGAHYLMRLSNQMAGFAQRMRRLGPHQWAVRFRPSPSSRCKYPGLPVEIPCRLIKYQRPGFRPSWLVTSLMDAEQHAREELIDLYHRRWSIETIYREWKHGLDIQNLRSHTPAGIVKEIHAQLLLSNLVRWIMTEAAEGTDQTPIDLSFLTTLSLVKNTIWMMIQTRYTYSSKLYTQLLAQIRQAKIRKRPGRSYPRPRDGKIKNKGYGYYQQPTRIVRKSA